MARSIGSGAPKPPEGAGNSHHTHTRAEEQYTLALEAIGYGLYDWDIDNSTIYYSPELRIMLGLSELQLRTTGDWQQRIHADDVTRYRNALVAHFRGETSRFDCEYRYLAGDGSWRWARQYGVARRDLEGRANRLIGATSDVTEIKQRERDLHTARADLAEAHRRTPISDDDRAKNEERFTLAMELINQGVYDWDIDGQSIYYSPMVRNIFRMEPDREFTPEESASYIHAEDLAHYRSSLVAHMKGDTPRFDCEYRYLAADGNWHWCRQVGIAQRDPDGRAHRLVGTIADVTEAKQRERELQAARAEASSAYRSLERAQQVMQTVLDNMKDSVSLYDSKLRWQFSNRQQEALLGVPRDMLTPGTNIRDLIKYLTERGMYGPVEDVDARVQQAIDFITTPGGAKSERRMLTGRYVEHSFKPLADGSLLAVARDITELKDREEALAASKEQAEAARTDVERTQRLMQTILDNMRDGVALYGPDLMWKFSNLQHAEIIGFPWERMRPGVSMRDVLRHQAERGFYGKVDDIDAQIEKTLSFILRPGGARTERRALSGRYAEFLFQPLSDGTLLAVARDITELKEREEALTAARDAAERERAEAEAANQAKSTFLATMSHEIRTPMNGVLGMMEVLERQSLSPEQGRSVATMRDSAQALLRIIDDVLDFSKIEAGRLELEETTFSLSALLDGVIGTLRRQAVLKGLALDAEIAPGSNDLLIGDSTRVRQILFNLIGNALKFTDRGHIRVFASTSPVGEGHTSVTLSVEDSGIGMDATQQARLFQPFSQADSSTTRRFGGTGLGLSIVRRLAELMNGTVAVDSHPGRGSTFTVMLTLRAEAAAGLGLEHAEQTAAERHATSSRPASRPRVLVADDHPVNREVLVRQLDLLGVDADTVNDGAAALAAWQAGRYDAVLADIHMPRMDGHAFSRALRENERENGSGKHTPVVAVTANAMKGEEERCLEAGMDGYIAKPVKIAQLRSMLERWLPLSEGDTHGSSGKPKPRRDAIDRSVLEAWLGDDQPGIDRLLMRFRETAVEAEQDIDAVARSGDLTKIGSAAHKLKGAAQAVGALGVAGAAAELELAAKSGDRSRCREGLGPLRTEMRKVMAELASPAR